ncbi:MAG TPA: cation:proton antiporter [Candidatus Paceibacterota bacterium]|nr:cation:proton antiporter [Candidatus Paceibacterota bacterium]
MSDIEVFICLILLLMAVPDVCRKLGRPALAYSFFVLFGLLLNPVANEDVAKMLMTAGKVGFLLLLFEVGLEIELPSFREFLRPLRFAFLWSAWQYPVIFLLAAVAGLGFGESLFAAASLVGCSVGMAHAGWKQYPGLDEKTRRFILETMVALEMLVIILLTLEAPALENGLSGLIFFKLLGMAAAVWLVSRFSRHLNKLFQVILERTTHWRVHFLVLLVLVICAIGERLGLSAQTAFFLGLFMSRANHAGMGLEEYMAPVSQRFLIPVFFVGLGLQINWRMLFTVNTLIALGAAFLLLGMREVMHRRWLKTGGDKNAFLLLCPNLTLVALAASVMLEHDATNENATWLLLTGLFLTVSSLLMLPGGKEDKPVAAS